MANILLWQQLKSNKTRRRLRKVVGGWWWTCNW